MRRLLCLTLLLTGCGGSVSVASRPTDPQVDYQQAIEAPTEPLMRWDDTSLGVVCYSRVYGPSTLVCLKIEDRPVGRPDR